MNALPNEGYHNKSWNLFFEKLQMFKNEFGHCNVPNKYSDRWFVGKVHGARYAFKMQSLDKPIIAKLNQMGFVWSMHDDSWNDFFKKLEAFKKEYGHCNIPRHYPDKWLFRKANQTRSSSRKSLLEKSIVCRLNEMGFVWSLHDDSWNLFIKTLQVFKKKFGHCNVPDNYSDKWLLGKVRSTRRAYKTNSLDEMVITRLNKIGFIWSLNDLSWGKFIEKLAVFQKEFGHCNVLNSYHDQWLVSKVRYARRCFNKGVLDEKIIDRLNKIGFVWQ